MRSPDDKGKFEAGIGQDVIDAALKSVEKHTGGGKPAEPAPSSAPAPATAAQEATPPGPVSPKDAKDEKIDELTAQLEMSMSRGRDLMGKIRDEHDKMLRAVADLENYKKRALKEKEEVQKFGVEKLLKDLLPVFDNLDRALEAARSPSDYESLRKGVEMIRRLFEDSLGKYGVKTFTAKGKPFDPNFHEAMTQAESAEMPPNHVHTDVLRGFTLNDRLIRPALVVVSKAPEARAPAPADGTAGPTEGGSPPPAS